MFNIKVIDSPYVKSRFNMAKDDKLDAAVAFEAALSEAIPDGSEFEYLRDFLRQQELYLERADVFTDIISYGDEKFLQYALAEGTLEDWLKRENIVSVLRASLQVEPDTDMDNEYKTLLGEYTEVKSFDHLENLMGLRSENDIEYPIDKCFMTLHVNRADGGGIFVICALKD